MKYFTLLLLFTTACVEAVYAQPNYATELIPETLLERALATVRHDDTHVHMRSKTHITIVRSRAVTVHHGNGDEHAEIALYYNKSSDIKSVKGEIYNEHGLLVDKFSLRDFKDNSASGQTNMYDDIRVKHYQPSNVHYPYTIAYTVEIKESQSLVLPVWRPDDVLDVSVEKSSYTFQCASEEAIRIDERNLPHAPTVGSDGHTKTYTWRMDNLKAVRSEPFSPPRHLTCTQVRIVPQHFQYYKKSGDFTNWDECGKWVYDQLLADKRSLPSPTITKIMDMTANAATPKEKAKILYRYLQEKTRYISIQVGIGGLEPFSAESVDRLGYGDCKALVNYMQSMLDAVGIPSYYCIVEAGSLKEDVSKDFANLSDGNHIILCIPFENDTTWLECTSQKSPFGFLGDFTDDRRVLACTPTGGKLLRTPGYTADESLQLRTAAFEVLEDGSLRGTVKTRFQGAQMDNHFYNSQLPTADQAKNLAHWYNVNDISFDNIEYAVHSDSLCVEETFETSIRKYLAMSPKYRILAPNIFNVAKAIPRSRNRRRDLFINRGYTDVDIITYTLPDNVEQSVQPLIRTLETPMGSYELKISTESGKLTSYRKIQLREGTYPPEEYELFYDFMREVSASDKGKYNLPLKN